MNKDLEKYCELFVDNRHITNGVFSLDWNMIPATAMLYTNEDEVADLDRLKECRQLLRKKAGLISVFREYLEAPLAAKMALSDDPEFYFDAVRTISEELDDAKVFKSDYMIIAAMIIFEHVPLEEARSYINNTKILYQKMRKERSIFTSNRDVVFSTLLAVSDIEYDNIFLEITENYNLLKGQIRFADNRELSRLLSLDLGAPGLKTERFLNLYHTLKERQLNFGSGYELNTLALLSCLDVDDNTLITMLTEVNRYLEVQKGFHGMAMSKKERLMYSTMIVIKALKPYDDIIDNIILYICLNKAVDAAAAAAAAA